MSFYFKSSCIQRDIEALISYIAALTDMNHLTEIVELLKHMLEMPTGDAARFLSLLSGMLLQFYMAVG